NDDPEARWATYDRGRPMTPRTLARRLAAFEIRARVLRVDGRPLRGYELPQFTDAFQRYLPMEDATSQPASPDGTLGVSGVESVTETATTGPNGVTPRYVTQGAGATPRSPPDGRGNGVTREDTAAREQP